MADNLFAALVAGGGLATVIVLGEAPDGELLGLVICQPEVVLRAEQSVLNLLNVTCYKSNNNVENEAKANAVRNRVSHWNDLLEGFPAFMVIAGIPMTYSI